MYRYIIEKDESRKSIGRVISAEICENIFFKQKYEIVSRKKLIVTVFCI